MIFTMLRYDATNTSVDFPEKNVNRNRHEKTIYLTEKICLFYELSLLLINAVFDLKNYIFCQKINSFLTVWQFFIIKSVFVLTVYLFFCIFESILHNYAETFEMKKKIIQKKMYSCCNNN